MNNYNELVELITREVLNEIGKKGESVFLKSNIKNIVNSEISNLEKKDNNEIASYIDHTLLKPEASEEEIIKICKEAMEYNFWSVCVNPTWVKTAYSILKDSKVKVCTVVGFPLGATPGEVKAFEADRAIKDGASEVDMVINIGYIKSKKFDEVKEDIKKVKQACGNTLLKVILETCLLTSNEKIKACEICKSAGADYVKTSTGFSVSGATAEDIALMRRIVGEDMGVKASGGVRDSEGALKMIKSGASRVGASASIAIVKGQYDHTGY
ncbi:MAG: deoxyribose-phosphate aldolase [Candidatus Muirbacterium halophilum]|nr:deoxyribose-phosphate aldolase [Candidatus Muirbacterium halophilum]MCK9475295.1 deoxyribose-phosphate aldolase [Candidatus Muirbacterium halophilum]